GNDVPGRILGAGRAQAGLICLHVLIPEFPLFDVIRAEFPVFLRIIDARNEALALLFFRKMQKKLNDSCSVPEEMIFETHDRAIPSLPDLVLVDQLIRQPFAAQDLGVNSYYEDFLVIGTIENANAAALRQRARGAPEKIV